MIWVKLVASIHPDSPTMHACIGPQMHGHSRTASHSFIPIARPCIFARSVLAEDIHGVMHRSGHH